MKVIAGKSQSGKTTQLIYESAKSKAPIVCNDFDKVHHIIKQAKELGIDIPIPIAFIQIENRSHSEKILVDDIFAFAKYLSKKEILVCTAEIPSNNFGQMNYHLVESSQINAITKVWEL